MFRRSTFELRTVNLPSDRRKTSRKKTPPRDSPRSFPCRKYFTRATKAPGHEYASQNQCRLCLAMREGCHDGFNGVDTGAACRDCAKTGHTCLSKAQPS
ncbi:uncharacterized protein BDZ83DRAFT_642632 [Colletotrichum acutatum]|uniref:Uncharacterized protein n=1 Tax=Glomerella acutata TaxID=27357 RepID=A0AAD8U631_GLOAC|nr:uncharacterized protein BDZ83DRAFT_642630 [Colletotrichum acutatum]XP_060358142.1 uncharacterized protein BDZ83DRAFT_642632 [Colletotrichum acutatum]KAK1707763.1 hypothetical protein BDZ83DRAFT_642630 [Colletotrichum acutatum]KAK1707764.1 hypothetical protein BDZ83DRAFT_642632 [Colletotrichum acutatum]